MALTPPPRPSYRPRRLAGRPHRRIGRSRGAWTARAAGALLARLRDLVARFRAVAGTPVPPPRRAPKPVEPRFVPTDTYYDPLADPPPERTGLPRSWRWLLRLVPQAAAGRAQLEALLRDPAMAEMLAADPRLGPILRPLGWMLGVDRALLPASRRRRRPVILVPGGPSTAAAAAADYAVARARGVSHGDLVALGCMPPAGGGTVGRSGSGARGWGRRKLRPERGRRTRVLIVAISYQIVAPRTRAGSRGATGSPASGHGATGAVARSARAAAWVPPAGGSVIRAGSRRR